MNIIRSLKIRNFKSVGDEGIEIENLGDLNVFVGENNSGKTAVLELLWFLNDIQELRRNANNLIVFNRIPYIKDITTKPPEIGNVKFNELATYYPKFNLLEWTNNKDNKKEIETTFSFELHKEELTKIVDTIRAVLRPFRNDLIPRDNILKASINLGYSTGLYLSQILWGDVVLARSDLQGGNLLDLARFFSGGSRHFIGSLPSGANQAMKLFQHEVIRFINELSLIYIPSKRKIREIQTVNDGSDDIKGTMLKRELYYLFQDKTTEQRKKYKAVVETFEELTHKKISVPSIDRGTKQVEVLIEENSDLIDIDNIGYGLYQILYIIYNLIVNSSKIILIDEPEISFHPQLQKLFFKHLKKVSKDAQIFVSTHSPYFIDVNDLSHIYKFTKKETTTKVFRITKPEEIFEKPNKERIVTFDKRELFFTDKAVFVEGMDDYENVVGYLEQDVGNEWIGKIFRLGGLNETNIKRVKLLCESLSIDYLITADFDYFYKIKGDSSIKFKEIIRTRDLNELQLVFNKISNKPESKELINQFKEIYLKYWKKLWEDEQFKKILIEIEMKNKVVVCPWFDMKEVERDKELLNFFTNELMTNKVKKFLYDNKQITV